MLTLRCYRYDCGLMLDTFETNNLTLTDGPYSYCPNLLSNTVPEAKCAQCLSFTDDMKFLGNCKHSWVPPWSLIILTSPP